MVRIGAEPILWHIMKMYAHAGFNDFVVALGYKGEVIADYFSRHKRPHTRREPGTGASIPTDAYVYAEKDEPADWNVRLVETGLDTQTGGRLHRLEALLRPYGSFMLTYGDGVCDLNLEDLVRFHRSHGRLATITAVRPPARFGAVEFCGDQIVDFEEKPQLGEGWINGGFMMFEPEVFDRLCGGEGSILEEDLLPELARAGELMGFRHDGFWHCMDTLRDKIQLTGLWQSGTAPWKNWG